MGYFAIINLRQHAFEVGLKLYGEGRIGFCPLLERFAAFCHDFAQLFAACRVESFCFGEDFPRIFGVAAEVAYCRRVVGTALAQGLSVGRALAFEAFSVGFDGALAHYGASYDKCRLFGFGLSLGDGFRYGFGIVAVDFNYVPVPCAVFGGVVFAVHGVDHGRQLYAVAVVEHYEVRQSEISGNTAGALRNFFLYAAVGDEGVCLVCHGASEASFEEALGYGAAHGHRVALAERAGGVFDSAFRIQFGVSRRYRTPLAELLQLVGSIVSGHCQNGV